VTGTFHNYFTLIVYGCSKIKYWAAETVADMAVAATAEAAMAVAAMAEAAMAEAVVVAVDTAETV
jgi:hypothetical protein